MGKFMIEYKGGLKCDGCGILTYCRYAMASEGHNVVTLANKIGVLAACRGFYMCIRCDEINNDDYLIGFSGDFERKESK